MTKSEEIINRQTLTDNLKEELAILILLDSLQAEGITSKNIDTISMYLGKLGENVEMSILVNPVLNSVYVKKFTTALLARLDVLKETLNNVKCETTIKLRSISNKAKTFIKNANVENCQTDCTALYKIKLSKMFMTLGNLDNDLYKILTTVEDRAVLLKEVSIYADIDSVDRYMQSLVNVYNGLENQLALGNVKSTFEKYDRDFSMLVHIDIESNDYLTDESFAQTLLAISTIVDNVEMNESTTNLFRLTQEAIDTDNLKLSILKLEETLSISYSFLRYHRELVRAYRMIVDMFGE